MILKQIHLQNFRNYLSQEFTFTEGINLIVGPNTVGKTNLLEAIYLLASRKSFRARLEEEMIQRDKEVARIKGQILGDEEKKLLEIVLTRGEINGSRMGKKKYLVNGVSRRMIDFLENFRVVYFGPQDLEIVVDSPSIRRGWLDLVLEQADKNYRRANLSYQKGLRQRNKLLEQIRDEGKPRSSLFFWDKLLIGNGQLITQKREEFLNFINENHEFFGQLEIHYDKSVISETRLAKYSQEEVAAGATLVGPHRDDFEIWQKGQNLHIYGSRGEQRTAVFNLKLAELEFLSEKTGQRAVLLLDDIFSELDHQRREHLLTVIPKQQTIITTADIHLVEKNYLQEMEVIKLP
ncbi:DNA replication and repair protein RecF [Patescibacteria group bacterium]|nr:DNA replication and repair protein RecF [Patescibacteria group bacterium]